MRRQSRSAIRYVFKNFIYLLPLAILSAILLALFQPPFAEIDFFKHLFGLVIEDNTADLADFHNSIYKYFSFINFGQEEVFGIDAIWFWLISLVVALASSCLIFSFVAKHVKYGTRTYNGLFSSINEVFLYVVPFVLFLLLAHEVWSLLLSGLIILFSVIFKDFVFYVFTVVLVVVSYIVFFILLSLMLMTPSAMFFDGYKFGFALGYSFHLSGEHLKEMIFSVLINVVVSQVALYTLNLLISLIPQETICNVLYLIAKVLFYLWWLLCLPCMACCKYVDFTETNRADLKLKLF